MSAKKVTALLAGGGLTTLLCMAALAAGEPPKRTNTNTTPAASSEPKEVTLEGRIVDLQCYMTGKYSMTDHTKCTEECLRNGVPAAIETKTGLFLIGEGGRGPGAKLAPFALTDAKVTGRVYEKSGLKYIDMSKVEKVTTPSHASAIKPSNSHLTGNRPANRAKP